MVDTMFPVLNHTRGTSIVSSIFHKVLATTSREYSVDVLHIRRWYKHTTVVITTVCRYLQQCWHRNMQR
jgi:hypothetical protein